MVGSGISVEKETKGGVCAADFDGEISFPRERGSSEAKRGNGESSGFSRCRFSVADTLQMLDVRW